MASTMKPLLCLLLATSMPALAWGPEGHALVSRIAETQLTPAAKARIADILGPERTLVSIASWADEVRRARAESGPWHYVDVPISKAHLDMARDCPKDDCILGAIARFRIAVTDPATPPDQRREALMFLVHFIGDLQQPLHCSDNNNDRGGNAVRVTYNGRQSNLHSLWDSGLLNRMPPEDQLFPELSRAAAKNAKKWRKGDPAKWAEQSHEAARKVVYGLLPKVPEDAPVTIREDYETRAMPLVKVQLEKGGVRLAALLNKIFQ